MCIYGGVIPWAWGRYILGELVGGAISLDMDQFGQGKGVKAGCKILVMMGMGRYGDG